jgi:hypothetical protein
MICEVYNNQIIDILDDILSESLTFDYISDLNNEIEILKKRVKGNKIEFQKELKVIKKRLMCKLIKENYRKLMIDFFPQLKDKSKLPDAEFQSFLFSNPENWSNLSIENFKEFSHRVEDSINYFYQRNHHENDNLKYLRYNYVK